MKIAVVCAPGLGDALIFHIASHHLAFAGHEVTTFSPHRFGRWLPHSHFASGEVGSFDAIFLQHDNSASAKSLHSRPQPIYTFYGSHQLQKHGPLRVGCDYVCDPNRTMVDNVVTALQFLFRIRANTHNGITPPPALIHRKFAKRVVIHTTSRDPKKNWDLGKFSYCAEKLKQEGYEPTFLPQFSTLDELFAFLYESGYFLGNDSGPGHIASCLNIPHLIIGTSEKHMRLWRPGWAPGEIVVPPSWIPNLKGIRFREKHWKRFISVGKVMNRFQKMVHL
jgi:heptosyltransferase-3